MEHIRENSIHNNIDHLNGNELVVNKMRNVIQSTTSYMFKNNVHNYIEDYRICF